ncbi:MAG: dihydrofolate reductase family protein [Actinomycetota bacterium]|nr:dihydrofolate reductase family protein [Actinomycetota bacterium]
MASVYYCAQSLDGYIAKTDDTIDWLTGYEGEYAGATELPLGDNYEGFMAGIGALVMGSATYEFVLGLVDAGEEWMYPGRRTWVLTSRDMAVPEGADVRLVAGDVAALHGEMATSAGARDLWVVGGGDVASQFADAGLLDRVEVTIVPVVLGAGKPLFDRPLAPPLRLASTRPFANGMVELRYDVAP